MSYNELRNVERSEETTASALWDAFCSSRRFFSVHFVAVAAMACQLTQAYLLVYNFHVKVRARVVAPVDRRETDNNGSHDTPRRFLFLVDDECSHLDASRSNAIVAFSCSQKSVCPDILISFSSFRLCRKLSARCARTTPTMIMQWKFTHREMRVRNTSSTFGTTTVFISRPNSKRAVNQDSVTTMKTTFSTNFKKERCIFLLQSK